VDALNESFSEEVMTRQDIAPKAIVGVLKTEYGAIFNQYIVSALKSMNVDAAKMGYLQRLDDKGESHG
jgi:hypothetical protein